MLGSDVAAGEVDKVETAPDREEALTAPAAVSADEDSGTHGVQGSDESVDRLCSTRASRKPEEIQ